MVAGISGGERRRLAIGTQPAVRCFALNAQALTLFYACFARPGCETVGASAPPGRPRLIIADEPTSGTPHICLPICS
jgi:hypothetical protein